MGSEVTVPAVVKLIESSIEVWNTEVEQLQAEQAKLEGANPPDIAKVHVAASPNAIRKQAEHFLRKYDFQVATASKPGKHLSTNDPQIIAVKEYGPRASAERGPCILPWLGTLIRFGQRCTNPRSVSCGRTHAIVATRRTCSWRMGVVTGGVPLPTSCAWLWDWSRNLCRIIGCRRPRRMTCTAAPTQSLTGGFPGPPRPFRGGTAMLGYLAVTCRRDFARCGMICGTNKKHGHKGLA